MLREKKTGSHWQRVISNTVHILRAVLLICILEISVLCISFI